MYAWTSPPHSMNSFLEMHLETAKASCIFLDTVRLCRSFFVKESEIL